jgi:hypothetical protein
MATYLHVLEGRIRIKVPAIKGAPKQAAGIERQIQALDGSIEAKANPTTGNVLLLFDPDSISKDRILEFFSDIGCLTREQETSARAPGASNLWVFSSDGSTAIARRIIEMVLQLAIERLIFALM